MNWHTAGEIVKATAPIAQLGTIVLGWWVLSRSNDRRERRKEIRSLLDDMRKRVHEIEAAAHKYYQAAISSETSALGMQLKQDLQRLARLSTIAVAYNPSFDVADALVTFRQRVTGQDFESANRVIHNHNSPLLMTITDAALTLIDEIETLFVRMYP